MTKGKREMGFAAALLALVLALAACARLRVGRARADFRAAVSDRGLDRAVSDRDFDRITRARRAVPDGAGER